MTSRPRTALVVTYALVAYASFFAAAAWAMEFLANVAAPTTIDGRAGPAAGTAVAIDLALLGAFAVHHSVMARDGAKRVLTRVVPAAAERSTYVLVASALLSLLLWQWRPISGSVWHVAGEPWRSILWLGYAVGWAIILSSTFMIDHLDLVGLRQARAHGGVYVPPTFCERWLYAWVRHPLMLGFVVAFWCTPDMTGGHLLFAGAATAYIAVGVWFEERGLQRNLGAAYRDYTERVPAILPLRRPVRTLATRPGSSSAAGRTGGPAEP